MKITVSRFSPFVLLLLIYSFHVSPAIAAEAMADTPPALESVPAQPVVENAGEEYTVGPEDILEFNVLRPEVIVNLVTVAADGSISLPYIGNIRAKGKTLAALQKEIAAKLGDGYMKYPVVTLALRESRSRKFFIYGEVIRPGAYPMEENMTVFRALAVAGGFTKFGDSSKVKILKPKTQGPGYESVKVDIKAIMNGKSDADVLLMSGDVVVVSEGIF
ncbi:MAG: polysaccharide biosynthesis/export family protein [Candidatus Omnitrophota bacterium]